MTPLVNLLLPLLFILSIGLVFHSIYLFLKSKSLRKKAIKRGIVPLIYIVGSLSFFGIRKAQIQKNLESELIGFFNFIQVKKVDSISFLDSSLKIILSQDNRFQYVNPSVADSLKLGTWKLQVDPNRLYFYSQSKALLWVANLKRRNSQLVLFFNDSTKFVKIK
jgi:hypothetical protein